MHQYISLRKEGNRPDRTVILAATRIFIFCNIIQIVLQWKHKERLAKHENVRENNIHTCINLYTPFLTWENDIVRICIEFISTLWSGSIKYLQLWLFIWNKSFAVVRNNFVLKTLKPYLDYDTSHACLTYLQYLRYFLLGMYSMLFLFQPRWCLIMPLDCSLYCTVQLFTAFVSPIHNVIFPLTEPEKTWLDIQTVDILN